MCKISNRFTQVTLFLTLVLTIALFLAPGACAKSRSAPAAASQPASLTPVYVHMNGANAFVEPVVAVRPGQPVVFVNEDTDAHTIQGYDPLTGKVVNLISGMVMGTPGPGHKISTYKVVLKSSGIYYYYCTVHAKLDKVYHQMTQPAHRPGVNGFGGAMAGIIIVTTDPALLQSNLPTTRQRILKDYFGG